MRVFAGERGGMFNTEAEAARDADRIMRQNNFPPSKLNFPNEKEKEQLLVNPGAFLSSGNNTTSRFRGVHLDKVRFCIVNRMPCLRKLLLYPTPAVVVEPPFVGFNSSPSSDITSLYIVPMSAALLPLFNRTHDSIACL
jgi:hypothetical protein